MWIKFRPVSHEPTSYCVLKIGATTLFNDTSPRAKSNSLEAFTSTLGITCWSQIISTSGSDHSPMG